MGPGSSFFRKLEVYLQVAASSSGISRADLEATIGCSHSELDDILSEDGSFEVSPDEKVSIAPLGTALLGGCLSTPWVKPPSGLFTAQEEDLWGELATALQKLNSGIKGLSVYQMLWQYFLLTQTPKNGIRHSKIEGDLILRINGIVGKMYHLDYQFLTNLVKTTPALEQYRSVVNMASCVRFDSGPNLFSFESSGFELTQSAAADTIVAFDAALQESPYALGAFIVLAAKPCGPKMLASQFGCSAVEIETAIKALGLNVTGTAKKYSLSNQGLVLFSRHFLRRSVFPNVQLAFTSSCPDRRAWYRAEQLLLNAAAGPKGEKLKDIAPEVSRFGYLPTLSDGVTPVHEFLVSIGLNSNWSAKAPFEIADIRILVGKIPALKDYRNGLSYAKKNKISLRI